MNKHKMLLVFVTVLCGLLPALLSAQVNTVWVRIFNAPGNSDDYGQAIAVDDSGNVYVTGAASFTPWPDMDYATVKYNSNGDTIWLRRYDGPGDSTDYATALAIDRQGNVYVSGSSSGSGHPYDYTTIKYNSLGDTVWVRRYNGSGNSTDQANAMAVDSSGNVYVTGNCNNGYEIATIKYNSLGDTAWVRKYHNTAYLGDNAYAMTLDQQGNVYVTGSTLSNYQTMVDYLTIKYNANGDTVWIRTYTGMGYSGQDEAEAIAVDNSGNVCVTGYSTGSGTGYDYTTVKYNASGDTVWVRRYTSLGNNNDYATAIKVDNLGNVYVTGGSYNSGTSEDYTTIKYNSNGDTVWIRRYNGPANSGDRAYAMVVDELGSIYVTGQSFGSGPGDDYATVKYNSAGVQQWVARYDGGSWDQAHAIAVKGANIYVTGQSWTNALSSYDRVTVKYVQTMPGVEENRSPLTANRFSLEVFPNPAKTYFTIRLPLSADHLQIKIFDVTGKLAKEVTLKTQERRITLDGIKDGVYFVQVGDEMVKEKLVVTR